MIPNFLWISLFFFPSSWGHFIQPIDQTGVLGLFVVFDRKKIFHTNSHISYSKRGWKMGTIPIFYRKNQNNSYFPIRIYHASPVSFSQDPGQNQENCFQRGIFGSNWVSFGPRWRKILLFWWDRNLLCAGMVLPSFVCFSKSSRSRHVCLEDSFHWHCTSHTDLPHSELAISRWPCTIVPKPASVVFFSSSTEWNKNGKASFRFKKEYSTILLTGVEFIAVFRGTSFPESIHPQWLNPLHPWTVSVSCPEVYPGW